MKIKLGDIVRCKVPVGEKSLLKQQGVVRSFNMDSMENVLVEFDNYIDGHAGNSRIFYWKNGHCWWVRDRDLEIVGKIHPKVFGIVNFLEKIEKGERK